MGILKDMFRRGQMTVKGDNAYGTYEGFPLTVAKAHNDNSMDIRILYHAGEQRRAEIMEELSRCEQRLKPSMKNLEAVRAESHEVRLKLRHTVLNKTAVKNAVTALNDVINVLKAYGCEMACELCGENLPVRWYQVGENMRCLCDACFSRVERACEEKDRAEAGIPVNYLKGIMGALLGALGAALVYMFILRMGRILLSSLLPVVPFVCFYQFGRRVDKLGSIVTGLISLIVFYFAARLGFCWLVSAKVLTEMSLFEVHSILGELTAAFPEIRSVYLRCMLEGYGISALLTVVFTAVCFFDKGKTRIKRM